MKGDTKLWWGDRIGPSSEYQTWGWLHICDHEYDYYIMTTCCDYNYSYMETLVTTIMIISVKQMLLFYV